MEQIQFAIKNKDNKLVFTIKNISTSKVLVNNKFSLGAEGKRGNIELYFTDSSGKVHSLSAKINYRRDIESDLTELIPKDSLSMEMDYEDIKSYYNLTPGGYTVAGKYKNYMQGKSNTFIGEVEAEPEKIEIE